jgi:hypothetical protein
MLFFLTKKRNHTMKKEVSYMFKKFAVTAVLLSVVAVGAACSSDDNKDTAASPSASPAASASAAASASPAASENPDAYKLKAYTAARIAEEKINILFHTSKAEEKAVMNPLIATDKDKAAKFLNAYLDSALTEKVLTHYLTADKAADGSTLVKEEKFLPASILTGAPTKDDVTYEGTQDEVKLTTKDNAVFTLKKNAEGKYIVTDAAKK